MAYCIYSDVNLLTNLTDSDVANADVTSIIAEATKELNRMINIRVVRERILYIDNTRENKIDGSNTTYYVKNWKGKYLADMDNDGGVDTGDVVVYQIASDGTETKPTISAIDGDDCYITLTTAPSSGVRLYITYEWCWKDVATPDPLIKLACVLLSAAYCYAKINIGMAPQVAFGNTRIYRHIASYDHYYQRFLKTVSQINDQMADSRVSELTI